MRVIYQSRGRAREYSEYALNIATGCVNGCLYCYVPRILRKNRELFHDFVELKEGLFVRIERDLSLMSHKGLTDSPVLLCFACDPYQQPYGRGEICEATRTVLRLFIRHGVPFQILTKCARAAEDFDLYRSCDAFGMTLTFMDADWSRHYEPNASLPKDRIAALKAAHDKGIRTWVSFEPVLDAEQVYELFDATKGFVDCYKIGKVSNFPSRVKDWREFGETMVRRCLDAGKDFMIKDDLKKHLIPSTRRLL
jgi:DNA repair photolyase